MSFSASISDTVRWHMHSMRVPLLLALVHCLYILRRNYLNIGRAQRTRCERRLENSLKIFVQPRRLFFFIFWCGTRAQYGLGLGVVSIYLIILDSWLEREREYTLYTCSANRSNSTSCANVLCGASDCCSAHLLCVYLARSQKHHSPHKHLPLQNRDVICEQKSRNSCERLALSCGPRCCSIEVATWNGIEGRALLMRMKNEIF